MRKGKPDVAPTSPDVGNSNGTLVNMSSGFALGCGRLDCGSGVSGSCLAIAVRRSSSCWSKTNVVDAGSVLLEISVSSSVTLGVVSVGKVASGEAAGRNWLSGSVVIG